MTRLILLTAFVISSVCSFAQQKPDENFKNIAFAVSKNFGSLKGAATADGFESNIKYENANATTIEKDKLGKGSYLKITYFNEDAAMCQTILNRVIPYLEFSLPMADFEKSEQPSTAFNSCKRVVYNPKSSSTKYRVEMGVVKGKSGYEGVILYFPL
jgi:hypothetical protein